MTERPLPDNDDATINCERKFDPEKLEKGGDYVRDAPKEESQDPPNGVKGEEVSQRVLNTLEVEDDSKELPKVRKWLAVLTISSAALCVTCTSSIVSGIFFEN